MREEVSNLVHRVLMAGLDLKERLARGENPNFEQERARLMGLVGDPEVRRFTEYVGETAPNYQTQTGTQLGGRPGGGTASRLATDYFLGIRYALVCWLDEIFILDSPWSGLWEADPLEFRFYSMNERAHNFWSQARRAESLPGNPLEAFYLCVMLGFRGEKRDQPDELQQWVASAHSQISRGQGGEWQAPNGSEPPINVPPLTGRDQLQRMVMVGGGVLLLLILIGSFLLVINL
jgi:type VI secretion system protein ImpK